MKASGLVKIHPYDTRRKIAAPLPTSKRPTAPAIWGTPAGLELTRSRGHLILGKTPEEGARSGSSVDLSRGVPA